MEVSQDFSNRLYALKGKRSKRSRPTSPLYLAGATTFTTSSSTVGGSDDGGHGGGGDFYYSSSIQYSPTTSTTQISTSSTSEEDEDMANCLILLAQSGGCRKVQVVSEVKKDKISSRKFTEMVSTTTGKAGFYVYECKTCNRTFPSFQALGGHRASHKRPKTIVLEEKKTANVTATATDSLADSINEDHSLENDQEDGQFNKLSPSLPIKIVVNNNNNKKGMNSHDNCNSSSKTKIHECSICGSEFSSGQALGGHMRRHRPPTTASPITKISTDIETISNSVSESSQKNFLSLDLNLPAPSEDDVRDTKFDFSANQQSLVFSTSALVDCHY